MGLKHGRTAKTIRANVGRNIGAAMRAGVKQSQAIAIALATARRDARKAGVKGTKPWRKKRK